MGHYANSHGQIITPYYADGIEYPLMIGVRKDSAVIEPEYAYIRKQEWIDERDAREAEVAELKARIAELEQAVSEVDA